MEKVRPHKKNEMFNEYFAVLKEKLDEIVDLWNANDISGYPPGSDLPAQYGGERPVEGGRHEED